MSDIVQRPDYTGKKIHHAEEFELCYLRHRYLRRSTRNPSAEEMAPYLKIIKRVAYSQHTVYHHIFNAISMGEDDLISIGQVHLVSYLNLYAIQVKQKKLEKFIITFAKRNMREPTDDEILNKNKADFTSFLNQRMIDIVRLCTLKSSSVTGKQMVEYFPYFGPNPPKSLDAALIGKYEKMGYKKIDRIGYRAAKNKANVKEDKPFWYKGNWYFVIYNEKTPLTQDDLAVSDANPFDNAHQLNPEQYLTQNAETNHWHKKLLQFEGDSVDNRVRLITNFITSKKMDPKYADEIKTARKLLKELGKKMDLFMRTILAWKESLGGRVPITSERVEYIMDLFKSLEANGFTMDEILTERNTLRIINACVNPTSKKKEAWAKSVRFNFETAVGRYFPPTLAQCTDEEKTKVAQVDTSNHALVPKKPEAEYEKIEWKELELPDPNTIPDAARDPVMEELLRFE